MLTCFNYYLLDIYFFVLNQIIQAAAVATGNAQQSLLAMQQQANAAAAMAKAVSASSLSSSNKQNNDTDMDVSSGSLGKDSNKPVISPQQPTFKINDVCQPGNTLLWDLLQDDKIVSIKDLTIDGI